MDRTVDALGVEVLYNICIKSQNVCESSPSNLVRHPAGVFNERGRTNTFKLVLKFF